MTPPFGPTGVEANPCRGGGTKGRADQPPSTAVIMKALLITAGPLAALFTLAQLLQLLGLIGVGFSIPGIGLTALGLAITVACFKKAFQDQRRRCRP